MILSPPPPTSHSTQLYAAQSSSDVPLLSNIRSLATRFLVTLTPSINDSPVPLQNLNPQIRIGFITPPFKDSKIPVTDHLHAHAFIGPPDLLGWWRGVAYGPLAWYAIEDLIAEIRCVLMKLTNQIVFVFDDECTFCHF